MIRSQYSFRVLETSRSTGLLTPQTVASGTARVLGQVVRSLKASLMHGPSTVPLCPSAEFASLCRVNAKPWLQQDASYVHYHSRSSSDNSDADEEAKADPASTALRLKEIAYCNQWKGLQLQSLVQLSL